MNKEALVCTIGDEILLGQILDTNSKWLSEQLTQMGFHVKEKITISDEKPAILEALKRGMENFDLTIMTGGLGPTKDDITKNTVAEFFGDDLVEDKDSLDQVKRVFEKYGRPLLEVNVHQALVPSSCTPLLNNWGTAPGMLFKKEGKMLISLPGVPYEMKNILNERGWPMVKEYFETSEIFFRTVKTAGIGESFLMEKIKPWEDSLPQDISLAYLPSPGEVKLRLTAKGKDQSSMENEVNDQINRLRPFVNEYIYGYDDTNLSRTVGELLRKKGLTLSTAESCTGGYLAHLITSEPGSSDYFLGSIVSYSNQIKLDQLGVSNETLEEFGAVSEQVVEQMALGICNALGTSFGIATSGIAGPTGGTPEKPVGTIWIAVSDGSEVRSKLLNLTKERGLNIQYASKIALNQLRLWLSK